MWGILHHWYLSGPWRYLRPVVRAIPILGSTDFSIGRMSASHCLKENVVAASGYSTVQKIVVRRATSAAKREIKPLLIRVDPFLFFPQGLCIMLCYSRRVLSILLDPLFPRLVPSGSRPGQFCYGPVSTMCPLFPPLYYISMSHSISI